MAWSVPRIALNRLVDRLRPKRLAYTRTNPILTREIVVATRATVRAAAISVNGTRAAFIRPFARSFGPFKRLLSVGRERLSHRHGSATRRLRCVRGLYSFDSPARPVCVEGERS